MRTSVDLRKRVVAFVKSGGRKAEAARRFQVGAASVHRWIKPAGLPQTKPGPKGGHKRDRTKLQENVEQHPDWTQKERARHFGVSRPCIGHGLRQLGRRHKKTRG